MSAAAVANTAWLAASLPDHRSFIRSLRRVRETQERLLIGILRDNAGTSYGRQRGFASIRSWADYRDRIPLVTWDDLAPFVDRIAAGETGILTRQPVRLLEPTGGSTRAAKWIPFTASLHAEFRRGIAPWIVDLFLSRPSLIGGPAYWSITPVARREEARRTAVPVGFDKDSAYLGGALRRVVAATFAAPPALRLVGDEGLYRRLTLLFLLRAKHLRLVSIWHPSFLSMLVEELRHDWNGLLRDLSLGVPHVEPSLDIPPSPARARELREAGPEDLRRIWPCLRLISAWGDGHAAGALASLRTLVSGVEVQPKGLLATEAFVSLPFRGRTPLSVRSHFFEFLDAGGTAHPAWDLEEGTTYSVVVTTGGGLYRYRLHDLVTITGYLDEAPCLRFVGKEDRVSDRFGEKLAEGFVAQVLERVLTMQGIRPPFAMLAPDGRHDTARYALFLEAHAPVPERLGEELDAALSENPAYELCRRMRQLAPVGVRVVPAGAYGRYAARLRELGQRLGDVKPAALDARSGWGEVLLAGDRAPDAGPRL